METQKKVTLGYNAFPWRFFVDASVIKEHQEEFLSLTYNAPGRILLALRKYLEFTKIFDQIDIDMVFQDDKTLVNGSLIGLIAKINRSQADIGVTTIMMDEKSTEEVDFCYTFGFEDYTFVTRKPRYVPMTFGIFQTLSLSVWITIVSVLIAMMLVYYFFFKRKCSSDKILLDVFAILLKQNALIIPSSLAEKLLIISWVVGAMILCLSYDSVFLSFLSFPPLNKIKDLSDLASAVKKGDYRCLGSDYAGIAWYLQNAEQENRRIIGRDMAENGLSNGDLMLTFIERSRTENLAYVISTMFLKYYASSEKYFVSEDRFLQRMAAMMVRKGFCCKDLIDAFVHRMMASGIYSKIISDGNSWDSMQNSFRYPENDTTLRKLTLTDVAPAFIFLFFGYVISFIVLIGEIVLNQKSIRQFKKLKIRKRNKVYDENSV